MAILRICFTKGCGIKTLGRLCLDCENAAGVSEPAARQLTLTSPEIRDLAPAA
jgi:hypothetical protein